MENKEKEKKVKRTTSKAKGTTKTKSTTKKKAVPTKGKVTKAKEKPQKTTEEKVTSKATQTKDVKIEEHGFWEDAKDNVVEGAKILGEEAKHLGKKISSYSEIVFGKIKDNTKEVFKHGLDLTHEGVHKAQQMAEHLKDDFEIKKLNNKKKDISTQLGIKFYLAIKSNDNEIPDDLMKEKDILSLLKELEVIDKEILQHSEKYNK